MSNTKMADPLKIVSKVSQSTHLDGVRLLRGSFHVERVAEPSTANPAGLGTSFSFEQSIESDHLLSRVSIALDVQQLGPPPRHFVSVKATIELSYKMAAKFAEDELEAFAKINGIYHAWPYWREFVQSATTRAGLPPLTLHPIQAGEAMVMAGYAPPAEAKPKAKATPR